MGTLATRDMKASCSFYSKVGLVCSYGGPTSPFSTFSYGDDPGEHHNFYINLFLNEGYIPPPSGTWNQWGRGIFYVNDVDGIYNLAIKNGLKPEFAPRNADWGERYFHILDPNGHEISLAKLLPDHPRWNPNMKL